MTPVRYLPRFRRAYKELDLLAERESSSRSEIESYQLDLINRTWLHACEHVPYYRSLSRERALPFEFGSLCEFSRLVPILSKEHVRSGRNLLLSAERAPGKWFRTGGSTGSPLSVYWSHEAHRIGLRRKYRTDQAWGLDFFDPQGFLWGHAASLAPGWQGKYQRFSQFWLDALRNRTRLSAYQLDREQLQRYLKIFRRRKIKSLYGYSSALTLMALEALRLGFDLPSLRLARLTAEPATAEMLKNCRAGFHCPATIEYGSTECGVIATGWPDGTLRVCDDLVYVETEPQPDGRHAVLVTVLSNPSFPLLRYAIGDVVEQPLSKPSQGFACMPTVLGRSNDWLISPTGRSVYPEVVTQLLKQISCVQRFHAHQTEEGRVALTIESEEGVAIEHFDDAKNRLSELLDGQDVTVRVVDRIAGNAAGKHRWVTSALTSRAFADTD